MRIKSWYYLVIFSLLFSCFQPDPQNETGTLRFQTSINENLMKSSSVDTCLVQDLIWRFTSFEVSTGRIIEGAPDTLEWISVYSDTTETLLSEFQFEAELPPGTYHSIRLAMRNRNWWIVQWGDTLINVEDWNRDGAPEDTPYSYYDIHGCWYCDDNAFENVASDESTADIVISGNSAVDIIMNWNLYQLLLNVTALPDSISIEDWIIREGHDMIEWQISD